MHIIRYTLTPHGAYSVVSNNIIGVGQTQKIIFWINSVPPTANGQYGDRWQFTIDVMRPDGKNDTLGPISSDPVGSGYTMYSPDIVGNYTVVVKFPTTVITGLPFKPGVPDAQQQGYVSINDTYKASVSDPTTFVAQQDPYLFGLKHQCHQNTGLAQSIPQTYTGTHLQAIGWEAPPKTSVQQPALNTAQHLTAHT